LRSWLDGDIQLNRVTGNLLKRLGAVALDGEVGFAGFAITKRLQFPQGFNAKDTIIGQAQLARQ